MTDEEKQLEFVEESIRDLGLIEYHRSVNSVEERILGLPAYHHEFKIKETRTPGLYCREIFMPATSILTSKMHMTKHPFTIMAGKVAVWQPDGFKFLEAPHFGVTEPMTRRVLLVVEGTIWITFHPTNKETTEEIEKDIILPHEVIEQLTLN